MNDFISGYIGEIFPLAAFGYIVENNDVRQYVFQFNQVTGSCPQIIPGMKVKFSINHTGIGPRIVQVIPL